VDRSLEIQAPIQDRSVIRGFLPSLLPGQQQPGTHPLEENDEIRILRLEPGGEGSYPRQAIAESYLRGFILPMGVGHGTEGYRNPRPDMECPEESLFRA
jgi:hypothetical protein